MKLYRSVLSVLVINELTWIEMIGRGNGRASDSAHYNSHVMRI